MAFKKNTVLPSGFSADYWRVVRINAPINSDGPAEVIFGLFKDKEASDAQCSLLSTVSFHLSIPKEVFMEDNVLETVYVLAKTAQSQPEVPAFFADAENA